VPPVPAMNNFSKQQTSDHYYAIFCHTPPRRSNLKLSNYY
jgi:hypothetical protein